MAAINNEDDRLLPVDGLSFQRSIELPLESRQPLHLAAEHRGGLPSHHLPFELPLGDVPSRVLSGDPSSGPRDRGYRVCAILHGPEELLCHMASQSSHQLLQSLRHRPVPPPAQYFPQPPL